MRTTENTQGDFGCGCCWREVVSTAGLACTFRVVGVVEDYNGTFERFEDIQEFKESSSCLGLFGDPGPRVGVVGKVEFGLEVCM